MFQCIDDYGNNGKRRTKCKTKMEKGLKKLWEKFFFGRNKNFLVVEYHQQTCLIEADIKQKVVVTFFELS